ncbi:hypothetical protein LOAG_08268 [Loa loa]|uniref:Uncharacterized protein n=1 Tax=Loa loa TaxID=7209 RepID=A0A1S0TU26_LOALO|nr:hypothetical protein LOAG_08268 [Loa loa]EFO20223.1 hypothetical protein LOAG_08268 [Loa loa]
MIFSSAVNIVCMTSRIRVLKHFTSGLHYNTKLAGYASDELGLRMELILRICPGAVMYRTHLGAIMSNFDRDSKSNTYMRKQLEHVSGRTHDWPSSDYIENRLK